MIRQPVKIVGLVMLALTVGMLLAKNLIASAALSGGVKAITGLTTQVNGVQVGLLKTVVGIDGLRVLNPAGFPEAVMVDVPELYVDYDLGALLKGRTHLERLRLHLRELNVVTSADGRLNLKAVKALEPGAASRQPTGRAPAFQIDVLELKVGKVVYADYTKSPPLVREFAVNIDERYERITNPTAFAGLVVSRALVKTTIASLANFDVRALESNVRDILRQSAQRVGATVTEGVGAAGQLGSDTLDAAQGAVEGASGTLKRLLGN